MEEQVKHTRSPRGLGFASLIIGIVALSIYVLTVAAFAVGLQIAGGNPASGAAGLLEPLALGVGAPVVCVGNLANLTGLVLGIIGWRRASAASERRFARIGVALNLLPALFYCLLFTWGFAGAGSSGSV